MQSVNTQQKEFLKFIKLLNDNDCLKHVILVGSWAEYVYKETGLIEDYDPNIKTLDIDFLLKNLRRPSPPQNLSALAREAGYIVQNDILDGTTKFLDKAGLEIEFLINKVGAGLETTLKTNLGVTAQSLRHMDIILHNVKEVEFFGMNLTVPLPEAYAVHKIIINKQRKNKQEKDRLAIINIWPKLSKAGLLGVIESLSKKEKQILEEFLETNNLCVAEGKSS